MRFKPFHIAALVAVLALGCATPGERVTFTNLPRGAPSAAAIVEDLAENHNAIRSFRAAGTFTLQSPELTAVQRFRSGQIKFRRPADLYVQGNHRITNIPMFKLRCAGDEFLLEVPTNYKQNYISVEGAEFASVPFPVSPSQIAKEIFLPEEWSKLGRNKARVIDYEPAEDSAVLEVGPRDNPIRQLKVARVAPDNPEWVILENRRFEDGQLIAVTTLGEYRSEDGILFPYQIEARFPIEETWMTLALRNVRPNTQLDDETFDVEKRARELGLWNEYTGANQRRSADF